MIKQNIYLEELNTCQTHDLPRVMCFLLASGSSRRFGVENKLLFPVHGKAMIEHVFQSTNLSSCASYAFHRVVITTHPEIFNLATERGIPAIIHDYKEKNQSIKAALECLTFSDSYASFMYVPCDQPGLKKETVEKMILHYLLKDDYILRLHNGIHPGAPVIFPKSMLSELKCLPEGKGGSYLISKYPSQVMNFPVEGEAQLFDIDTKEDIATFEKLVCPFLPNQDSSLSSEPFQE